MIGRTLGHYAILDRLGAGGMGEVYRARDQKLRREVALKLLPADDLADPVARARLVREARLASSLNHPHISTIYEVGEDGGHVFIAMELVEGRSLSELLAAGPIPMDSVLRFGAQIADALAHAHGRGVIHRDLKGANVVVTPEGRAKVLDFGVARRLVAGTDATVQTATAALTETGVIVGTAHYLSPEVLHGGKADARSDLWALGVLLYEMASGSLPFQGNTGFEVAAAILHSPPKPLPETVPGGLRAVIERCLEKDPAGRYPHAAEVLASLEAIQAGAPGAVAAPSVPAGRSGRRRLGIAAGLAVAAVAAVLVLSQYRGCPGRMLGTSVIRSLAVLPLANLSGDVGEEYFADGMTDELITELAGIASLKVIARGSVMIYKGTKKPLNQIARELGVEALVEGTVTRAGDRVRVRAQLARGRTGESLWADSFERDLKDVLALQADIARAIVLKIQLRLEPREQKQFAEAQTVDPEAYQAYLKGRFAWNRYTLEGFTQAREQFQRAVDRDPTFAPAWTGLADAAYGMSSIYVAPDVAIPQARAAAEKALALDPELSEAYTSLGIVKLVYDWDWNAAAERFDRAIELKPGDANAHWWRGRLLICRGRFHEGVVESGKALELDPLSSWFSASHGWHLFYTRRYDEAARHLRDAVRLHPDDVSSHVFLGLVLAQQGDYSGAVAELEKGVSLEENNDNLSQLALVYGTAGRRADAERTIARLLERRKRGFVPAGDVALAYSGLRNEEETLRWLERGLEDHSEMLLFIGVEPGFDWIRGHPRFKAVMRRIGVAP